MTATSFWQSLNDHYGNLIVAVVTFFVGICAGFVAYYQCKINIRPSTRVNASRIEDILKLL